MRHVLKKQDRNDFESRIKRLDPAFAAMPKSAKEFRQPWEMEKSRRLKKTDKPIVMLGVGFALAVTALFAANNPETVQDLLIRSGWPGPFLGHAMNGISILIIGLIIFYIANMLRIVNPRATGRRNAVGLVVGAAVALGVSALDESHIQAGYQMAGLDGPVDIVAFAQEKGNRIAEIDWAGAVMVSSSPK
ncbi:hypothetical protein [Marivita sp.]|uniref:hypothetical protein n=1 Tax=Marivita sp. TaxID=2003365 RepID=UPI0025C1FD78|nr:hypothetical protein [Marivita sp.]